MKHDSVQFPLISERVQLTPFKDELINDNYLSWMQNTAVTRYLVKPSREIGLQDLRDYVRGLEESPKDYIFAITTLEGLHIGNLRIGPIDWDIGDSHFGMMIGNTDYHGKGIGREAFRLTLQFVFEHLKLKMFTLEVTSNNLPAIALYSKSGMKEIGKKVNAFSKDGITADLLAFRMLRDDFKAQQDFRCS